MTGVVIIAFIWAIFSITSGQDVIGGVLMLLMMAISAGVGVWIFIDDEKRKKDGERCMRNWEEYKRKNRK